MPAGLARKRMIDIEIQYMPDFDLFCFEKVLEVFPPKGQGVGIQDKSKIEETAFTSVWVFVPSVHFLGGVLSNKFTGLLQASIRHVCGEY